MKLTHLLRYPSIFRAGRYARESHTNEATIRENIKLHAEAA